MASQNFRSAFNGFNREDVVRYLEYLNSKQASLVNQLTEEVENLRQKLKVAAEAIAADSARAERIAALEEENARLMEQLEEAHKAQADADAEKAELEKECADLLRQLTDAKEHPAAPAAPACPHPSERELEAYRRAERTERLARERADQLYRRTNGVLAEASVKVDQVASDIGSIADQVVTNLQQLQQAVTGSKQALQEAADLMYTIRPEAEN